MSFAFSSHEVPSCSMDLEMVIFIRPKDSIDVPLEVIEPSLEVPAQQEPAKNHDNCVDQDRQLVTKPEDIAV